MTATETLALASRTTKAFAEAFRLLTELDAAEPMLTRPMVAILKHFAASIPDSAPSLATEHN